MQSSKKKRTNDGELTRDNFASLDDNGGFDEDPGTFARASAGQLRKRRIVRVRRSGAQAEGAGPAVEDRRNPFAGISLTGAAAGPGDDRGDVSAGPMAGGEGSAGATPSADAGAGQADNSGTGMGHSEGAVTPEKSKVENGAQVSDACAGPTPMLGTDETGMDPKRKREEGSDGKGSAAEKGPNAVEEPANKKGKVEVDTVGLVSPSPSTGDGSTPFAAFASSASPFQGMASGTDFGNSNIFSAPPLNLGSGTAPAFSFGTQIAPLQSVEGAGLLAKTPMGGGAGNPSGSVTLSTDGTGGQSLQNKPLFSSGPAAKLPQQVKVVTGEEDESTVFAAKGILYQMDGQTWKETCRGELRLNVQEKRSARLVMRQKATLKVCLNANLYAQMPVSMMDRSSGVVFHCVNWADEKDEEGGGAEGSQGTASKGRGGSPKVYAVRFVDKTDSGAALAESFMHLVNMYKGKVAGGGPSAPQE